MDMIEQGFYKACRVERFAELNRQCKELMKARHEEMEGRK